MAIRWLDSVRFDKLHPAMLLAISRVEELYYKYAKDTTNPEMFSVWITSANDGVHNSGSVHSQGKALDFRTKDLQLPVAQQIAHEVTLALGPQFFVKLEAVGSTPETSAPHLHIQFNGE